MDAKLCSEIVFRKENCVQRENYVLKLCSKRKSCSRENCVLKLCSKRKIVFEIVFKEKIVFWNCIQREKLCSEIVFKASFQTNSLFHVFDKFFQKIVLKHNMFDVCLRKFAVMQTCLEVESVRDRSCKKEATASHTYFLLIVLHLLPNMHLSSCAQDFMTHICYHATGSYGSCNTSSGSSQELQTSSLVRVLA